MHPMATLKSIGRKIVKARNAAGLSQEDVAGEAEVNRAHYSNIENGKANFSIEMLFKICKALKIKESDLFE